VWQSLRDTVLHPVAFFRQIPARDGRAWLGGGLLSLLLVGVSAVRRTLLSGTSGAEVAFSEQLVTALLAAGQPLAGWFVLMLLLSLIPMLRKRAPSFALNWRIAIWASVPFALMALAQIGYIALGETITGSGLAPVVPDIPGYDDLRPVQKILIDHAASQITLFGLWHLVLLYIAGRHSLNGSWWAVLLTVLLWLMIALLGPGALELLVNPPPPDSTTALILPDQFAL
jgi:hypothetical protein